MFFQNLQLEKKQWEHQQEDYEKQVNDLKEQVRDLTVQLEKAKNEAAQARAESSGGIRIDKSQEDIVKKIADELLACKIRTDTLQTDKSKLEVDFETLRERLQEAKKKFGEVKVDETMKAEIAKVTGELQSCKSDVEKLQEESGKFEQEYNRKTRQMRDQLGNELVVYKMNMSKLMAEKENLEMDKDSLYDQIKKCESRIADVEETKEKLQMDKDSLYGQIKDCKTLKAKDQDYETIIAQLQKKAAAAEAGLQNCETRMKTKEQEVKVNTHPLTLHHNFRLIVYLKKMVLKLKRQPTENCIFTTCVRREGNVFTGVCLSIGEGRGGMAAGQDRGYPSLSLPSQSLTPRQAKDTLLLPPTPPQTEQGYLSFPLDRTEVPPPPRLPLPDRLHNGQYASCGHVGGLSCCS